jgi:pyridoxine kinase
VIDFNPNVMRCNRLLSETKITSLDALHKALKILHSPPYNVPHVVISSIPLPLSLIKKLDLPTPPKSYTDLLPPLPEDVLHGKRPALSRQGSVDDEAEGFREKLSSGIKVFHTEGESMGMGGKEEPTVLVCFASTNINAGIPGKEVEMKSTGYALPTVQGYYSGVGDLFSALVLGHYKSEKEGGEGLERAVALALLGVQQVLLQTHLFTLEEKKIKEDGKEEEQSCIPSDDELDSRPPTPAGKKARLPEPSRKAKRMRMRELKIVQERGLLMQLGSGGEKGWTGKTLDWQGLIG